MSRQAVAAKLFGEFNLLELVDKSRFIEVVLQSIRHVLSTIELPSKADFLTGLSDALDQAFAGLDTPGPDIVVEPMLKAAILSAAGFIYDQIDAGGVRV